MKKQKLTKITDPTTCESKSLFITCQACMNLAANFFAGAGCNSMMSTFIHKLFERELGGGDELTMTTSAFIGTT